MSVTVINLPASVGAIAAYAVTAINGASSKGLSAVFAISAFRRMNASDVNSVAWFGKTGARAALKDRCISRGIAEASFKKYVDRAGKVDELHGSAMGAALATATECGGTGREVFAAIVDCLHEIYATEKALLAVIEPKAAKSDAKVSDAEKAATAFATLMDMVNKATLPAERMREIAELCELRAQAFDCAFKRDEHGQVTASGEGASKANVAALLYCTEIVSQNNTRAGITQAVTTEELEAFAEAA